MRNTRTKYLNVLCCCVSVQAQLTKAQEEMGTLKLQLQTVSMPTKFAVPLVDTFHPTRHQKTQFVLHQKRNNKGFGMNPVYVGANGLMGNCILIYLWLLKGKKSSRTKDSTLSELSQIQKLCTQTFIKLQTPFRLWSSNFLCMFSENDLYLQSADL